MNKTQGFTLIEVLIALVVLSGGLLGLAAMQATALSNNQSAYNRSQAIQLIYDIADRMRANATEAQRLGNSQYATFIPTPPFQSNPNCYETPGCATTDLAQNDLNEWNNTIAATLPGCSNVNCGTITVNDTNYTVTIQWDDNRDGNIDSDDPSFQLSMEL